LLRRCRRVAAIHRVGVLEVHFGDAREILAHELHGIHAAQRQMTGVGRQPDVLRIGQFHHPSHVALALHGSPDMRMRSQPDSHCNRVPADLVERVGESLQLIVARPARRPVAHVALPDIDAERLEKIARERDVIGDRLRNLIGIDEVRRLSLCAVRHVDQLDSRLVEQLLEPPRIAPIPFYLLRVRLDALQSQGGYPSYRPLDLMLRAPERAGDPEENVGVDGIEGTMRNRTERAGWPNDARRGGRSAGTKGSADEFTAIQHGSLHVAALKGPRYGYLSSPNA